MRSYELINIQMVVYLIAAMVLYVAYLYVDRKMLTVLVVIDNLSEAYIRENHKAEVTTYVKLERTSDVLLILLLAVGIVVFIKTWGGILWS